MTTPGSEAGDIRRGRRSARVIVVMPAYNAARTLEKTYGDLPKDQIYEVILVDDVSHGRDRRRRRAAGAEVSGPRAERGLRRQPEDLLPGGAAKTAPTSW